MVNEAIASVAKSIKKSCNIFISAKIIAKSNKRRRAQFVEKVPEDVENMIADHMIAEATIAAHLVAVAEAANLSPQQINQRSIDISKKSVVEEFWITNEVGKSYLTNVPVDFTFSPDPVKQPQAYVFWQMIMDR